MNRRRPLVRPVTPALARLREIVRENVPAHLGTYLRHLAQASIVVGGVATAGCSSSHFPPGEELLAPQCVSGQWHALDDIQPATPHDSIARFANAGFAPPSGPLEVLGTECDTASDPTTCASTIQELSQNTYGNFLMTSDGDDVRIHATEAELLALLGPIDTASEALIRVWQAGYVITCDDTSRAGVREVVGGFEVIATRTSGGCGSPVVVERYLFMVATDGTMTELAREEIERMEDWGCEGRRPEGLQPVTAAVPVDPVGRWFASMARLEASAVDAFHGVADELRAHGAPDHLVEASRVAADDEVRHHAAMTRLARRYGAEPLPAEVVPHPVRPLYAVALENAIEGCLRETYGALAAHRQAFAATDPEVAAAMTAIAEDESRHAALSWEIAAWIEPRLTDAERAELSIARARAFSELRAEAETEPSPRLVDVAGLPDASTALALLDHLAATIFA